MKVSMMQLLAAVVNFFVMIWCMFSAITNDNYFFSISNWILAFVNGVLFFYNITHFITKRY